MSIRSYMDTTTNLTGNSSFDVSSFVEEYLRSSVHSWSIGVSGAIGEFMYDDGEEVEFRFDDSQLSVITPRGALQIRLDPDIKCVAYEEVSSCTKSWSQNVVFCIPDDKAKLNKNNVLTHLGLDAYALINSSKHKHLFDLGVDSAYMQFCVRSGDKRLVNILKENSDRSVRVRQKSAMKTRPLAKDLENCWAIIVWKSNATTEALINGIPVFVTDSNCSTFRMGKSDFSQIENPYYSNDREQFFWNLAANEWTLNEIAKGDCWNAVQ